MSATGFDGSSLSFSIVGLHRTAIVGPGTEFSIRRFGDFGGLLTADVSDAFISMFFNGTFNTTTTIEPFVVNFQDVTNSVWPITGVQLTSNVITQDRISWNENGIFVNIDNLIIPDNSYIEIDVLFSYPPNTANSDHYQVGEDGVLSVAANGVLANDSSGLQVWGWTLPAHGTVAMQMDGSFVYTPQSGYSGPDSFVYRAGTGPVGTTPGAVFIQVDPTNGPPAITSDGGGDTAGLSIAENGTAITTATAADPDAGQTLTYATAGGADAALFTLDVNTGALAFAAAPNFEAPSDAGGDNVYDVTVQVSDGNGGLDTQAIAVTVTNANEAPVITTPPVAGAVQENGALSASGTMAATDQDAGAIQLWSVVGGSAATGADYTFSMDRLNIIKNGATIFADEFDDGAAPPSVPVGSSPPSYAVNGTFNETAGRLIMDDSGAVPSVGVGTPDPFVGQFATLRTNIDPANLAQGLKSDDDFTVEGRFDLILPDSSREAYGIRLSDRLQGGSGTPPDQPGDDAIELVVRRAPNGAVIAQLLELDFDADEVTVIQSMLLNPPPGADQIELRLSHSTTGVGAIRASFDYLAGGVVVGGTQNFSGIGRIFGTETPGVTGDDENWTLAQIVSYAPQVTDSTLTGSYGSLNINQAGQWTYNLANGQANVQALAAGETVTDDFTIRVSDGAGGVDTETVSITVAGANDAPTDVVLSGDTVAENAAAGTLVGTWSATDIDNGDTATFALIDDAGGRFALANGNQTVTTGTGLDFEDATSHDIVVRVTDSGGLSREETFTIAITNANEAPTITSNGGGETASVSVTENATFVTTVAASDPDAGQMLTYSIAGGADAALFEIRNGNELHFIVAPDVQAPADAGANNVYDVTVQVSDGNGGMDTQAIAVTVGNVNEAPTFVGDGMTTTAIGPADDFGRGVAVQPDGKILVAGSSFNGTGVDFAVVRYDVDGRLDTSFGSNGKVVTDLGGADDNGYSAVVDPDGKILVAGYTGSGADFDFAIVRYNADGSLDTGFGDDGKVITDLLVDDFGQSIALQSDGKIVFSGYSFNGSTFDFALVRYNADGSLDTTFDGDGKVTTGIASHDASYSVALQSDGKIVAAGHSFTGNGPNDFAVVRYNVDGSLDTSFGGDGKVTTDLGGTNDVGQSVAIQADGKIVVAGISQTGPNADIAIVRYNTDGSLDTSFDGDGSVRASVVPGSDAGSSVAIQPDGKILVTGNSFNGSNTDVTLVRYNVDGSLDTAFGIGGVVTTQIGLGSDEGYSVKLQPDGKILIAGYSSNGSNADFALLRYNADGSLDTTFGAPDLLSISIAENTKAVATLVATDPDTGQALTYAITGGQDASKFLINLDTGALSFSSAPNFEAPTDTDGDNVYRVTVQVSDSSGETNTQAVAVTVTDVDDIAPRVMSVTRSDNTPTNAQTVHYTVTFSEAVIGVDPSQFSLTTTGAVIGAGIAGVMPVTGSDDAQYVVTVDTGSGDGTVALGVTGAEVHDLTGNPLAGGAFHVISSISGIAGHVTSGDLNGDGEQDLVSESSSGEISVMMGNGDGTLQEPVIYAAGHDLNGVSIADVDNDGVLDLAISNAGANGAIAILLGNGDGTFQSAISSPTNRAHSSDSTLADLNRDGRLDVLVANTGNNGGVSVLLGNGDGSFSLSTVLPSNADPLGVAAADLNGDGNVDVAFSNVPGAYGIQIYLGTGDGTTFTAAPNIPASTHTASVALEDLDGDADADLVFSSYDGTVSVALANGDGSFQAPFSYTLGIASDGVGPGTVTLANVNGDDALDLVYANPLLDSVSVLLGNGDGTFQSQQLFATGGTQPGWTAVGDFTADGRPDIAVANFGSNSISILQDGPPTVVGDAYAVDKNDAPAITSNGGGAAAGIAIVENSTAVTTVTAADPDTGQTLTFTIAGGADESLFTIDANTGVLSFNTAPDFEIPTDADANNIYDVIVQVSDGVGGIDTQAIAATVSNVNERPVALDGSATTLEDTSVVIPLADLISDPESPDESLTITATLTFGAGSVTVVGTDLVLTPAPNSYGNANISYTITDEQGHSDTGTIAGVVTPVNDAPFVGFNIPDQSAVEGSVLNFTLRGDTFQDLDGGDSLTLSTSTLPDWLSFNPATGVFTGTPSVSDSGLADITVTATDSGNLTVSDTFRITVADANQLPVITSNGGGDTASVSVPEMITLVTTLTATDADASDAQTFSISSGEDAALFELRNGNQLHFRTAPDFEALPPQGTTAGYQVNVQVADGQGGTDTQEITAAVVKPNLVFDDRSVLHEGLVGTAGAADVFVFDFNHGSGIIRGETIQGFESGLDKLVAINAAGPGSLVYLNNSFVLMSFLGNGGNPSNDLRLSDSSLAETDIITFQNNPFNSEPTIDGGASLSISLPENSTLVRLLAVTDPDPLQTLTFSISGGEDAALFELRNGNELHFRAAPDFEGLPPQGATPAYQVNVQVSDGQGGTDTQAIAVTVQNVAGMSLTGNGAANTLNGTGEEDTLSGQGGTDTLLGLAGNDELSGGAGGDLLDGGAGNDRMAGGAGNDAYVVDSSEDIIVENIGEGTDTIRTALAAFALSGVANVETLTFVGIGDFTGTGNADANVITGGTGNDALDGAGGADRLVGLAGNDTYLVDNSSDVVVEAANAGTDTVVATSTTYSLSANTENLTYGGTGSFNGTGNGLANTITGGSNGDTLSGAGGNDTIIGASGSDTISGGAGDDMFVATAGDGNDSYAGNGGNDTYSLAGLSADAVINLTSGTATSSEIGTDGLTSIENVVGGSGQDTITASNASNELFGGAGNDTFIFASTAAAGFGTNRDLITDFTAAADRIDVSGIDANGGQAGNPEFVFVGEIANVVGGVGQLGRGQLGYHYETDANGIEHTIVEGSVDADAAAEFQIDLVGRHILSAGDFSL